MLGPGALALANQPSVVRRLAAILAADVVGYSRLMGGNEIGTLVAFKAIRCELANPAIASHGEALLLDPDDAQAFEGRGVAGALFRVKVFPHFPHRAGTPLPEHPQDCHLGLGRFLSLRRHLCSA